MRHLRLGAVVLLCLGCAGQGADLQKLLRHFEKSGVRGRYYSQRASLGADYVGQFNGDNFSATIYQFPDEAAAQAAAKAGIHGKFGSRNGRFVLIVERGEGYLLPAFQSFR